MPTNGQFLDFSTEEYRSRVTKAQQLMKEQGLDALLLTQFENLYYFSGYLTWLIRTSKHRPTVLIIPSTGDPILILPGLEEPAARLVSWVSDMRGWSTEYVPMWIEAFNEIGALTGRVGAEMGEEANLGMPINDWNALLSDAPGIRWVDAQPLMYSLRSVKSPAEVVYMREAARLAGVAMGAAWDLLRSTYKSGKEVTEWDVFRAMTTAAMAEGAMLPGFVNVRSGKAQGMMHNKYPTKRVIQKGDWVAMDYGFIFNNYNSDVIRVGSYGSPAPEWEKHHRIQVELADTIRSEVKPGVTVKELCDVKAEVCARHGLSMPWNGIGHCIGLNIHELPRINPDVDFTLVPGVTFTCEPGFEFEGNTFCVEDVVLVTETGSETLSDFSRQLFIAG